MGGCEGVWSNLSLYIDGNLTNLNQPPPFHPKTALCKMIPFTRFCFISIYICINTTSDSLTLALSTSSLSDGNISKSRSTSPPVKVWDGVLSSTDQRKSLHDYASKAGLGHKCFTRPLSNIEERNIIERTLDAILTELDDSTSSKPKQYVEYWTRQEWRHIEAHSDVDESLAKKYDAMNIDEATIKDLASKYPSTYVHNNEGGYRYPTHGHVLYLQVGTDVKGPTCVFPRRSSGGDLLQPLQQRTEEGERDVATCDSRSNAGQVELIIVPAVSGRLLRFDGEDLHAVPRPHDLWMLPFVKGGAEYKPEETWGRSVILFNVWPGDEDPPLDVPLDEAVVDTQSTSTETNLVSKYPSWTEVPIEQQSSDIPPPDSQSNQSVKVWLLGNERRRGHPMRTAPLLSPEDGGREAVRGALGEKDKVTQLWLRHKDSC